MMKKIYNWIRNDVIYIGRRLGVIALSLWCFFTIYIWYTQGFWLFFLLFILTGAVLSIVLRNHLMLAIRSIEMQLWGKPLDKTYWQNEKPPKLKFVWKRDRSKE